MSVEGHDVSGRVVVGHDGSDNAMTAVAGPPMPSVPAQARGSREVPAVRRDGAPRRAADIAGRFSTDVASDRERTLLAAVMLRSAPATPLMWVLVAATRVVGTPTGRWTRCR